MTIPFVSIIVPVYRAEQYIAKCGCALMEQTLQDVDNWVTDPSICLTE
jgi:glycosyltransferase involved in cell wall biosynthesis